MATYSLTNSHRPSKDRHACRQIWRPHRFAKFGVRLTTADQFSKVHAHLLMLNCKLVSKLLSKLFSNSIRSQTRPCRFDRTSVNSWVGWWICFLLFKIQEAPLIWYPLYTGSKIVSQKAMLREHAIIIALICDKLSDSCCQCGLFKLRTIFLNRCLFN